MKKQSVKYLLITIFLFSTSNKKIDNYVPVKPVSIVKTSVPLELIILRSGIINYATKMEVIRADIELELFFENQPFKTIK